ncbi:MAG: rhombotarget lipoprotein [Gammaproteobacteria bacterium]|nr:MAG: rhombotarget lipoprotein [Gammaproteobacteria bacterium]
MNALRAIITIALGTALATGCSALFDEHGSGMRTGVSSSLVDYLYPKGDIPPPQDQQIPHLVLPLRVGLAFVPGNSAPGNAPTEALKNQLLEQARKQFLDRKYIASIEVIPETYLRSTTGFEGMQQVARLYGADVMALVSYDQVTTTTDNKLALTYWTIVGAYVIKGTENQTQTFVDTAVFDVASRKLLFRAPGVDAREESSTAVEASQVVRDSRAASFTSAMSNMTTNLAAELDRFQQRLKDEPQLAEVEWKGGSKGGGGALGLPGLAILAGAGCWRRARKRCLTYFQGKGIGKGVRKRCLTYFL